MRIGAHYLNCSAENFVSLAVLRHCLILSHPGSYQSQVEVILQVHYLILIFGTLLSTCEKTAFVRHSCGAVLIPCLSISTIFSLAFGLWKQALFPTTLSEDERLLHLFWHDFWYLWVIAILPFALLLASPPQWRQDRMQIVLAHHIHCQNHQIRWCIL